MAEDQIRILVVDDTQINRLKLSISLQKEGYAVMLAEDGEKALKMLKEDPPDVVLLDIIMPGIDGYTVLERIKGDANLRDIPVIVISALDDLESVVRCIEQGAEDYLPKNYDPVVLRARLNSSMQRKRLRDLEKAYLQQEVMLRQSEKLATLGKMSAGLAHEMNNPAAAVQRNAAQLEQIFERVLQFGFALVKIGLTQEQVIVIPSIYAAVTERMQEPRPQETLERIDRETELSDWLEDQEVQNSWEIAPILAENGVDRSFLETLLQPFSKTQWPAILIWLVWSRQIHILAGDISLGASRISEIVHALKSYSYMDQAPIQQVDLHAGLDNTLVILRSKISKGVRVIREYAPDMSPVEGYGSELNQVWTNLIDNAIDAVNGSGQITLRTRCEDGWAIVEVEDSGPGIPEAWQQRIFEPFTTTKPPGRGTGLGLNISHNIIVQKHNGKILVHSQPGSTRFEVWLPVHHRDTE